MRLPFLLFALCHAFVGYAQNLSTEQPGESAWVAQTFAALTPEERLGQLMSLRAHSNHDESRYRKLDGLIERYGIGGLCFFQGNPEKQAELTNRYQRRAKVPLMISMDAEWGLGMRLKENSISFPRQLTLGAIQDNRLVYDMGEEVAKQLRRLGVHVNFAPVADVNNNPNNPVINTRSFGEDRYNVAVKSYMYMQGMQDHNVLACAKHFPGHGDTDVDSHYDTPVITHGMERLDSIELFPFKILFEQGIGSVMMAHLQVPAIDTAENTPTSVSRLATQALLKKQLGYNGLVFTDGLGMQGVRQHYPDGELEVKSLEAGNDILLLPQDVPLALKAIETAIADGRLSRAELDERTKKVLRYKYRLGLTTPQRVATTDLRAELNNEAAVALKRQLFANALTLVRDEAGLVPFARLDTLQLSSIALGSKSQTPFQRTLGKYSQIAQYNLGKKISPEVRQRYVDILKNRDAVIVSLHDMSSFARKDFGITADQLAFVRALSEVTEVILVVFGNPYSLVKFDDIGSVLVAYEEDEHAQDLAAQALFGAFSINGRLPVTASPRSPYGAGLTTPSLYRLGYGLPAEVGLDSDTLALLDELMAEMIDTKAAPGGVVLVAKDGKVIFEKAYGHHTYSKRRPTQTSDVFDLASITKIAASTVSLMRLYDEGKVGLDQPLADYLEELNGTNKGQLDFRNVLAHRARLRPWIPFYVETLDEKKRPSPALYKRSAAGGFDVPVTNRLFMQTDFRDTMWQRIYDSPLRSRLEYRYSDLGFYLTGRTVERLSGQPLDRYAYDTFYRPLGLRTMGFRPAERLPREMTPPTEKDTYWRQQVVQGYVHDMGAAMLGGVAGHAGLFSNANDLAVMMQMLLQKGYYGGRRYLEENTVRTFTTRCGTCSRRGLGFDMPQTDSRYHANMSVLASHDTFGHLGFTGTAAWADPASGIVFVFLSNRTYPTMKNNKLGKYNFRPRAQDIVYRALTPQQPT